MYQVKLHKKVIKFINKQNQKDKQIIKEKLQLLSLNPYPNSSIADTKKLVNHTSYRLRIRNFRIIYEIFEDELMIYLLDANNRGDIY